ncbi:MAG: hypothetical protein ACW99J_19960 [Candidatus Thorarchaeota archaeon]|jgi:hypothetical protein
MESLGSGEVRTVTKKGEKFVHEEDVEKLARLLSLPKEKVARWLKGEETPDLISDVSRSAAETGDSISIQWSMDEVDRLLKVYPDLTEHPRFKERCAKVRAWFEIMEGLEKGEYPVKPTHTELKRLSESHGVTVPTIRKWLAKEQIPLLLLLLKRRSGELKARRISSAAEIARYRDAARSQVDCKIDASFVPDLLVKEPHLTVSRLAEELSTTMLEADKRLIVIDVDKLSESVSDNLGQIESDLRHHLRDSHFHGLRVTLALMNPNLYVRVWDDSPLSYINLFENELFYFEKEKKRVLQFGAMAAVGARSREMFSNLVRELCPSFSDCGYGVASDFQSKSAHFKGMTLHLIMDILGLSFSDLDGQVVGIAPSSRKRHQIVNPEYLEGEELLEILARLFAIVACDGNITKSGGINYHEKHASRRQRVKALLKRFGDVQVRESFPRGKVPSLYLPAVLGRLLTRLGVPQGDKVLQGMSLPDFILNGSERIQLAYLQELIPEEGSIQVRPDGRATIQWGRTVVLFDERKERLYGRIAKIGQDHIDLVLAHGKFEEEKQSFRLTMGVLRDLMNSSDKDKSLLAKELMDVVTMNPSAFLEDERRLCSMNQIKTNVHASYIRFYLKTERVSLHWEAQTSTADDVVRWYQLAPPNDVRKRKKMHDWVSSRVGTGPSANPAEGAESKNAMAGF